MKNRYIKVSHINEQKFKEIVKLFSLDLSATQITDLTKLNRNIINRYLKLFRERIVKIYEKDTLQGIIRGKVDINCVIHSDGWRDYHGLADCWLG